MSTIRKKPYIEAVVESLNDDTLEALKTLLNGGADVVNKDFSTLPAVNTATAVLFSFAPDNVKTGILVRSSTQCCLIAYHRFQDLLLYKINPSIKSFEKVNEYCDINELRRIVFGGSGSSGEDVYATNLFASDEIEFTDQQGDFGELAKERINEALDTALNFGTNTGGDPVIELSFADGSKSSEVALNKGHYQVNNNHLENVGINCVGLIGALKFEKVSALPATPDANTLYIIIE